MIERIVLGRERGPTLSLLPHAVLGRALDREIRRRVVRSVAEKSIPALAVRVRALKSASSPMSCCALSMRALVLTSSNVPSPRLWYKMFFPPGKPCGPHITGAPFHRQVDRSPGAGVVDRSKST